MDEIEALHSERGAELNELARLELEDIIATAAKQGCLPREVIDAFIRAIVHKTAALALESPKDDTS